MGSIRGAVVLASTVISLLFAILVTYFYSFKLFIYCLIPITWF